MYFEVLSLSEGKKFNAWKELLENSSLVVEDIPEKTVLLWEGEKLVATGSLHENIIKYIAVDKKYQGENLTSTIITTLRSEAFKEGNSHIFLYTKPENKDIFSSLFFYPITQTQRVLLMENKKNAICDFLSSMPKKHSGKNIGSIIMNCNPFTLGHKFLIEAAAQECDYLYVFIVSEDKSRFKTTDRLEMAKLATKDLKNVSIYETGPYLISSATFPAYFLKEINLKEDIKCGLDIKIFTEYFVPAFSISKRFVGTEPICSVTKQYNSLLKENLPKHGIELIEIPRIKEGELPISASKVRELIDENNISDLKKYIPETTFEYLKNKSYI